MPAPKAPQDAKLTLRRGTRSFEPAMGIRLSVQARETRPGVEPGAAVPYEFDQSRIRIGRAPSSDVVLPHRSVSTLHATIEQRGGRYVLVDHGTTNGSRVNGQKLVPERPKPLRDGDRIDLGAFVLAWKEGVAVTDAPGAERTAALARRLLRGLLGDTAPSVARFVVANGPQQGDALALPTPPATLRIGRASDCDLVLQDADASRVHLEVTVDLEGAVVRDLGSKNGLVVNARSLPERRLLDRDELLVGSTVLVFEDPDAGVLHATEDGEDEVLPESSYAEVEPPAPSAPADDPEAPTGAADPVGSAPAPTAPSTKEAGLGRAELFVFGLAALVIAASVAGLVWLTQGG